MSLYFAPNKSLLSAILWFHKIQRKTMWLGKREKKVLKVAYSCFLFIFFLFLKRPSKKLIFLIYFFAYPKLLALNIKGFQFRGILILLKTVKLRVLPQIAGILISFFKNFVHMGRWKVIAAVIHFSSYNLHIS